MTKTFAAKTLNSTHVPSSRFALDNICNWKRGGFLLVHGSLSKKTLFSRRSLLRHTSKEDVGALFMRLGPNTFKIRPQFHKKLISLSSFMNCLHWSKTIRWRICIDNVFVFSPKIHEMRIEVRNGVDYPVEKCRFHVQAETFEQCCSGYRFSSGSSTSLQQCWMV